MWFYNILLTILTLFGLPYLLIQQWRNPVEWKQRAGNTGFVRNAGRARPLWFHAASVGEVRGISPVIREMREQYPNRLMVLSTMTATGQETARNELGDTLDHLFFIPLDFKWACRVAVWQIQPALFIIAETELWPNLIDQCHRAGSKIIILNGRISDRTIQRYRLVKWVFSSILKKIDALLMQTAIDAERVIELGAPPERVHVVGSTKSDQKLLNRDRTQARQAFGLPPDAPVFVAGSTRPGEEALVLAAFDIIRAQLPNAILVIAPRHLDRVEEISRLVNDAGVGFTCRTQHSGSLSTPVLLLDTMGELQLAYAAGDVAFVGGTLVPIGGHNLLEPAALGVPVLFGEYTANVRLAAEMLQAQSGGFCVRDSGELGRIALHLLSDLEHRQLAGEQARQVVAAQQGVTRRVIQQIERFL
ncbi:MAG: 3-deoxy-D-manno-octulosonic acid transferase [Gemmatimonadetes bacterium]|nr:MAG: 3-deoxy-D-manno-octulosonic acid transferase [Gemmatimonadota bacterium]